MSKLIITKEKESLWLLLFCLIFFSYFQLKSVYGGDSGDFLSAAAVWGIPHPPGYPLYALLAGILHHFLPWGTPAWRLALLSSIPAAITIFYFYKLINLFSSKWISLASSLFLAFNYPFWLYSEVVEVFSLNNLFIISLSYWLIKNINVSKPNFKLFFLFAGLALSHHHTILFLLPGILYIFKIKKWFKQLKPSGLLFFILGLLPYLYLPLAALKNPAVNWNNPVNLINFINLITRKAYGTFMANKGILTDLYSRFLNILSFFRFISADFGIIGLVLILIGLVAFFLYREHDKYKQFIHKYFLISLASYVFFIFYASFDIYNDFNVGTFERFIIIPYIFLTVVMAMGLNFINRVVEKKVNKEFIKKLLLIIFIIVLPLAQFIKNYPKISILKNDLTAENFAQDVLDSIDINGSLFAYADTSHFDLQYLFYSLEYRKNQVKYINVFMLPADYYQEYLQKIYPNILINQNKKEFYNWKLFLEDNYSKIPVYSIPDEKAIGYESVPIGIIYRFYKIEDVPEINELIKLNDTLWNNYHNPLAGSLSKYKNLFLSDVVYYYQVASKKFGEYLLTKDKLAKAEEYLVKSKSYKIKDMELELLLGRVYLGQKKCDLAEKQFKKVKESLPDSPFPDAYLRQTYLDCYKDEEKANNFLNSCFEKEKIQEIKLQDL